MSISRIIFAIVFFIAIGFFLRNVYLLIAKLCLGRWENRFDHLFTRLKNMLLYAFGQRRVVKSPFGINHFIIFWGFMILLALNAEFLFQGLFPSFSLSFIGDIPYGILLLITDIMSLIVLVAVVVAVTRRLFFRPSHIEPTFDAFFILGMIAVLMIAYFGYHAGEILLNETQYAAWMPVSNLFTSTLAFMSNSSLHLTEATCWWIHALVLLFFLNYLPYSKHLHVLTAIPNCFFRSFTSVTTVPTVEFEIDRPLGISKVTQFSWKDLLDFMACTECGRCQAECPATQTQKVLNPKEIIHKGKENLFINGQHILATRPADTLAAAPEDVELPASLINESSHSISEKELWDCTTCGSCMEQCPVFIEHVPKIVEMRRHLVMEQAKFPEELLLFFNNIEQRSNPWGIAPTDRAKWTQDLDVPFIEEGKEVDFLYFVGCAGAFDSRNREVVTALIKIFNQSGLSYAVLGTEEKCCGDSLRRLGNEYVFEMLVKDNLQLFDKYGIKKIVTHCPHCFSTFKNDYQQFDAELEVIHHTELLNQLMQEGKLKINPQSNQRTVYHDSCYLGRYNNVYSQPRELLRQVNGGQGPLEMKRHGEKSFCCGAGGGRMWLEETDGKRIYLERTEEALKCDPSTIAVACPYCMTMFEDGIKQVEKHDTVKIKDVAEIIADAM